MVNRSLLAAALAFGAVGLSPASGARRRGRRHTQEADRPRSARPHHGAGVRGGAAAAARRGRSPRAGRAGAVQPEELRGGGDDPARRRREVPEHARLRRRAVAARRVAVPGARLLLGAPLPAGGGRQEHGIEAGAAGAAAAGRDRAAHGRLRQRRFVPGPPAEPAGEPDGAGDAVRARQVLLLPQPSRRRGGGVRVDPADQPLLLPGALLPGHHRGQEGRPRGRQPAATTRC